MKANYKKTAVSEKEAKRVAERSEAILSGNRSLNEELLPHFAEGIDNFYRMYAAAENGQDAVRAEMEAAMAEMSENQRFSYLVNVSTAVSMLGGESVQEILVTAPESCKTIIDNLIAGTVFAEDIGMENLTEINRVLFDLVVEQHHTAVLFSGTPAMEAIHKSLSTETSESVESIVMNNKLGSLVMAQAIYELKNEGQMPSLPADLTPEQIGALAAASLEVDAAIKTGLWDEIKEKISTIMDVITFLIGIVPYVLTGFVAALMVELFGVIPLMVAFGTAVLKIVAVALPAWMIYDRLKPVLYAAGRAVAAAAVSVCELAKPYLKKAVDAVTPLVVAAVNTAKVVLAPVVDALDSVVRWVKNVVTPKAVDLAKRVYSFLKDKVFAPIARFAGVAVDTVIGFGEKAVDAAHTYMHSTDIDISEGEVILNAEEDTIMVDPDVILV